MDARAFHRVLRTPGTALLVVVVMLVVAACEREQRAIKEDLPAVRIAKARGDAQAIASAVRMYATVFSALPESLAALTSKTTVAEVSGGPFMSAIPAPPAGWSGYEYTKKDDGTFAITSAGDGTSITVP